MDKMVNGIRVFFYIDDIPPIYEADDEGRPERDRTYRVDTLELRTGERMPKGRLMIAAKEAARFLARADTPPVGIYDQDDLKNAYSKGYHDALDGNAARPETLVR